MMGVRKSRTSERNTKVILKIELETDEVVLIQTALMDKSRICEVELDMLRSVEETKETIELKRYWWRRALECDNLAADIGERWRNERDKPPLPNRGVNSNFGVDQDV